MFKTGPDVFLHPAFAHPVDPVPVDIATGRGLPLGNLEVSLLPGFLVPIACLDTNNHLGVDRADLVFIVDQIVAFPAGGYQKAQVGQKARLYSTRLKPCP